MLGCVGAGRCAEGRYRECRTPCDGESSCWSVELSRYPGKLFDDVRDQLSSDLNEPHYPMVREKGKGQRLVRGDGCHECCC